jgi:hypothetical protein
MLAIRLYYSEYFFGAVVNRVRVVLGGAGGAGCASTAPTPMRLLFPRFACQPLGGFEAALLPL